MSEDYADRASRAEAALRRIARSRYGNHYDPHAVRIALEALNETPPQPCTRCEQPQSSHYPAHTTSLVCLAHLAQKMLDIIVEESQ